MSAVARRLVRSASLTTVLLAVVFIGAIHAQDADLDRYLNDQYQGHTLLLRGFYSNDHLSYDASGLASNGPTSGDWTADGFVVVDDIHVLGQRLSLHATRMFAVSIDREFQLRPSIQEAPGKEIGKPARVEIEADLGADRPTQEQAAIAMSKIFLTSEDHLPDLVPDYWKPCVPIGLTGKDTNCNFSRKISKVPGVSASEGSSVSGTVSTDHASGRGVFRVGGGVSAPKPLVHKDPEFSEPARRVKFHGTETLGLIVNEQGIPENVHILSPLGCGLDAKAVQAVQRWTFKPAEKDGHPVPVLIMVEVDFHLY